MFFARYLKLVKKIGIIEKIINKEIYRRMKKHYEVVGAVILENGKLFSARRGESKFSYVAHKYEFAGGKIEAGETGEEAIEREIREELGAKIKVLDKFDCVSHEYPDFTITLHTYLCEFITSYKNTEHEDLKWLPLSEIKEEEWAPADIPVLRKIIKKFSN